jgi:putative membrane protein
MEPLKLSSTSRLAQVRAITLRWLISSLAIFVAISLVPGISFTGPGWQIGVIAMLFGMINALLRPLLTLLTCPLVVLSLGLFGLVINALLLLLTARLAAAAGVQFIIDGFWPAFFGGLVISLVSLVLGLLAGEPVARVIVHDERQR